MVVELLSCWVFRWPNNRTTQQPNNSHPVQLQLLVVLRAYRGLRHAALDSLLVPDDEVICVADDHHVVGDAGDVAEDGRDEHAAMCIDRGDMAEVVHPFEQLLFRD